MIFPAHYFRKAILVSAIGHFVLFGVFGFSFGRKIPKADFPGVSFLGQLFYDFSFAAVKNKPAGTRQVLSAVALNSEAAVLEKKTRLGYSKGAGYFKPAFLFNAGQGKAVFKDEPAIKPPIRRQEPVVMFYPSLPQYFSLYFKDRQVVHIELLFNIILSGKRGAVAVKRKVSSGNLEADLLSMRYVSRYLYMQHRFFPEDKWQAVKIDLSVKR